VATFIFRSEGAVEPKQDSQYLETVNMKQDMQGEETGFKSQQKHDTENVKDVKTNQQTKQTKIDRGIHLPWSEAAWVSLNLFLPVEIPSGVEWKPSSRSWPYPKWGLKFSSWATLLKLVGWILIPVGLAGLTGWLKR
jgi:hypothetical protein